MKLGSLVREEQGIGRRCSTMSCKYAQAMPTSGLKYASKEILP